MAETVIFPQLL